jgi:hypothetical protein
MKRWYVELTAGKVEPALIQNPSVTAREYYRGDYAFVLATDELGAFVRAKQLLTKKEQDQ